MAVSLSSQCLYFHFFFLDLTVIKVPGDFVSKRLTHVITQHDIINPSKSLNNTMNLYGIF